MQIHPCTQARQVLTLPCQRSRPSNFDPSGPKISFPNHSVYQAPKYLQAESLQ